MPNKNANYYCGNCDTSKSIDDCKTNAEDDLVCNICSGVLLIDAACCDCDKTLEECEWVESENDDIYCEKCYKNKTTMAWIDATEIQVRKLCEANGWHMPQICSGGFNTESRYYELSKDCNSDDCDCGEECSCRTIKLRISDHGSCYCSEDISLAMNPSGDDHTIEVLESLLMS